MSIHYPKPPTSGGYESICFVRGGENRSQLVKQFIALSVWVDVCDYLDDQLLHFRTSGEHAQLSVGCKLAVAQCRMIVSSVLRSSAHIRFSFGCNFDVAEWTVFDSASVARNSHRHP